MAIAVIAPVMTSDVHIGDDPIITGVVTDAVRCSHLVDPLINNTHLFRMPTCDDCICDDRISDVYISDDWYGTVGDVGDSAHSAALPDGIDTIARCVRPGPGRTSPCTW